MKAIQALASRYDNDPRVNAFQLGILGYWGEWHTSGFSAGGVGDNISDTTKNAILNAYKTSFTRARIQGRYPWEDTHKSTGGIGFHNDFFRTKNGLSDGFDLTVSNMGQWLNGPIGGEVPPGAGSSSEKQALWGAKGESMISIGRYSTMAPGAFRVSTGDADYNSFMKLHRMMGYNYQIETVNFADSLSRKDTMQVQLMAKNTGVAPLYYDWQVQFALLNSSGVAVATSAANFQLTTAKPGDAFTLSTNLLPSSVSPGSYRLAVRIIQPGADVVKSASWKLDAPNAYILFANDLPTVAGSWGADNALKGGWSVLGAITLR